MNHAYDLLDQFRMLFYSRPELLQESGLFFARHSGFAATRVSPRTRAVASAFSLAWIISLRLR
jgi:hypothetical protein